MQRLYNVHVCVYIQSCTVCVHTVNSTVYHYEVAFLAELNESLDSEMQELRTTYLQLKEDYDQIKDKLSFFNKVCVCGCGCACVCVCVCGCVHACVCVCIYTLSS